MRNKKTLLRIEALLTEIGVNPIEEIIRLLPRLKAAQRIEIWFDIWKFVEAPKRAGDQAAPPAHPPFSPVTGQSMDPEALLSLVKQ